MKIFLDANIFVAACGSDTGGSRYLFTVAEYEPTWHLLTSPYAIQEARLNVEKKLSKKLKKFNQLILAPTLTFVDSPPISVIAATQKVIVAKDAPILAAALCAQAKYICTLDQKDFNTLKVKFWCKKYNITVVTPGDLLLQWRKDQEIIP